MSAEDPASDNPRASLRLLGIAFAVFGVMFGVWQVLLEDLRQALSITPGPLGLAYTIAVVGSFPAMIIGGRIIDRTGAKILIVGAATAMGLVFVALTGISNYAGLVAVLFIFLTASGVYDVGINAVAIHQERRTARTIMPLAHAAFSGGGATGAIVAGLLLSLGLPFRSLYLMVAALLWVVAASIWFRARWGNVHPAGSSSVNRGSLFKRADLLLVALIISLAFLAEGAMETWSAIYLRGSLELPVLIGASGVAVFHLAMATGRIATTAVVRGIGRRATLGMGGLMAAVGNVTALATDRPAIILAGFLMIGIALAGVAPVALSIGGDLVPDRAGQAASILMTLGYAGFSIGPTVIGSLAEAATLRLALSVIGMVGLAITYLSTRVATTQTAL
ncbi:MAG TPA: MFS transporter [Thermomicrobiales bacterium]|nr:MFS transporter [Thermomicrobiales bacterium]